MPVRSPFAHARAQHVVKMILEMAQLLSTAFWVVAPADALKFNAAGKIYKKTHTNHPMAIWVREHANNYRHACDLALALCDEYVYRYGAASTPPKQHKSRPIIEFCQSNVPPQLSDDQTHAALLQLPDLPRVTMPPQAMPDCCRVPGDTIAAYRRYYHSDMKIHLRTWKNREVPTWFDESVVVEVPEEGLGSTAKAKLQRAKESQLGKRALGSAKTKKKKKKQQKRKAFVVEDSFTEEDEESWKSDSEESEQ